MGSNEKYCLRWNDFENNIKNAFCDLKEEKDFADVTLVCRDGKVEAHKVILSAGSTFFQKILKENLHSKPLIYLKGVKFSELNSVLGFVYHGEASIAPANLRSFLALAEELEVKGLRDKDRDRGGDSGGQTPHPPASTQSPVRSRPQPPQPSSVLFNNNSEKLIKAEPQFDQQEGTAEVKDVPHRGPGIGDVNRCEDYDQYEDYDQEQDYDQEESYNQEETEMESVRKGHGRPMVVTDLDQYIVRLSGNARKGEFKCKLCGQISSSKFKSCCHVESKHFPGHNKYNCDRCNNKFDTYHKLKNHRHRKCPPTSGSGSVSENK